MPRKSQKKLFRPKSKYKASKKALKAPSQLEIESLADENGIAASAAAEPEPLKAYQALHVPDGIASANECVQAIILHDHDYHQLLPTVEISQSLNEAISNNTVEDSFDLTCGSVNVVDGIPDKVDQLHWLELENEVTVSSVDVNEEILETSQCDSLTSSCNGADDVHIQSGSSVLSVKKAIKDSSRKGEETSQSSTSTSSVTKDAELNRFVSAAMQLRDSGVLPPLWIPIATDHGLNILKVSDQQAPVTQRSISISHSGALTYFVHGRELPSSHEVHSEKSVDTSSVESIVNSSVASVSFFRKFDICCGVPHVRFKSFWKNSNNTVIDKNLFKEIRYRETCRSDSCFLVVTQPKRMCHKCLQLSKRFCKRSKVEMKESAPGKVKTPNKYKPWKHLITPERRARQERTEKNLRNIPRQNARLKEKINSMIQDEGMAVDDETEEDLRQIVEEAKSKCEDPLQRLFVEQQLEALSLKDKRSMRWHPMVIRLALRIKMISSAAYRELAESGVVALPSERTLFDYSHVMDVREGICDPIIADVAKRVNAFVNDYQHNHTLMFDEVYISQNIVQRKATGQVVGYCKLNEVQEEFLELERKIKESAEEVPIPAPKAPPVAKRILSYMVKGIASNIHGVVASFPVYSLTKEDLMDYTWNVIEACEVKNIRIISVVCDGSAVNRAFIQMHPPVTKLESVVVFDTLNVYAPDRNIYFFSDLPHLAKTVRNCLYNSGRKGCRRLFKNGEYLTWDPIVRLYNEKKEETVTKLHKLCAGSVFLNSYSRMKVSYAMRVLSASVSNSLSQKKWPGTAELSIFGEK